ncbi:MAG: carbonic anhydrase [Candidatus Gastranaerophilales bacterium]|nr:carbonic anhydrase [Candidatus Gastranaerophilales bacterium]
MLTPKEALQKLIDGNKRFTKGELKEKTYKPEDLKKHIHGQRPYAVIASCSDSRVIPERIFDADIGELFVIRLAGNIITDIATGSIEYAVQFLGAKLVVILGHNYCGAVDAAINNVEGQTKSLQFLIDEIKNELKDIPENACPIEENIIIQLEKFIKKSPLIEEYLSKEKINVVKAFYDLDDGSVRFF